MNIRPKIWLASTAIGAAGLALVFGPATGCGSRQAASPPDPIAPSHSNSAADPATTPPLRPLPMPVDANSNSVTPSSAPPMAAWTASLPRGAACSSPILDCSTEEADTFAQRWARRGEMILQRLRKILPPRDPARLAQVKLLVFSSRERFAAYAEQFAPQHRRVAGYLDPNRREVVCMWTGDEAILGATLLHEFTHVVLRDFLGHRYPPPWLDEGLACYYETGRFVTPANGVEAETLEFGAPHPEFSAWVAERLNAGKALEWRPLATMGFGRFATAEPLDLRANYAASWSLVFYLINGDSGLYRPALQLYLDEIARQPDYSTRYREAFDLALGPRSNAFMAGWQIWARQRDHAGN